MQNPRLRKAGVTPALSGLGRGLWASRCRRKEFLRLVSRELGAHSDRQTISSSHPQSAWWTASLEFQHHFGLQAWARERRKGGRQLAETHGMRDHRGGVDAAGGEHRDRGF